MKGQDRRGDQIAPEPVEWLVDGLVPRGHITLLVGVAGYGKSTLTSRFVADITTGVASGKPENVLISATEDHVGAVTIPRLKAAGAMLSNIYPERSWRFPRDLELFEQTLREREISCVVIDPLDDAVDNIGGQDGRQTLGEIAEIAETYNTAIIAVHHFTKSGKTVDRAIGGGRGVQGVSRSIMVFGPEPPMDPDATDPFEDRLRAAANGAKANPNHMILAHYKCNLGPLVESRMYERRSVVHPVDKTQTVPVLELVDAESPFSAEEVFQQGTGDRHAKTTEGTRDQAKQLILAALAEGPLGPGDLEKTVRSAGFGKQSFMKARKELADEGEIEYQEFPANIWKMQPTPDAPPKDWK